MQVTGFVGSAGDGAVGGIAGAKVATAFVGGIALAFGVTFGAAALAVIAIAALLPGPITAGPAAEAWRVCRRYYLPKE